MTKYIRESIKKFKNDALSKGIYDILKWLIISLIVLILTKWIPYVKTLFLAQHYLTTYSIIVSTIVLITITTFVVSMYFRKKISLVLNDNHTDELTGLKNHKALSEYLSLKIYEAKNQSESISLILIDIDDFKKFNSDFGYSVADQILKKLGELLGNDKRATDETFRYFNRGDEFLVITSETNINQAKMAAERKREFISKNLFSIDGVNYHLTVSCGVTELKKDDDYSSFTNRVIEALNVAKKIEGKNSTISIS